MILTCPQCQSQYNLDPGQLGAGGRTVRCVSCNHTWFQPGEEQPLPPEAPPEAPQPADPVFEAILSEVSGGAAPPPAPANEEPAASLYADPAPAVPRPPQPAAPVITHDPFGVGAKAFGGLTFLLWLSLTLLLLFLGQKTVVRHWPSTALLYKSMGFDVKAPGEGIRLSEIVSEQRTEKGGRVLVVEGKMTNMSEGDIPYPALRVALKNAQGEVLKEWKLEAGLTVLSSGEAIPLALHLPDMPGGGAAIEVGVRDK